MKVLTKRNKPVALVTGGAKGVGAYLAQHLAKSGFTVVLHYFKSKNEAEKILKNLRKISRESFLLPADLRQEALTHHLINSIKKRCDRLDVIVHTVGNFCYQEINKTTPSQWQDILHSNLSSLFYLAHYTLPMMRKQKYGRLITFGAVDAGRMIIRPKTTPYYIAKAGVIMLTKQLAAENAKFGITINAISPGIMSNSKVKLPTPTGRYIEFEDIWQVIVFLLKPENQNVNGANIEVAGGFTF